MCGNENKKNTILLNRNKIISNCCLVAMLCVTFSSCNASEKPVFNDDITSDTKVNTSIQTSEIESETQELPLSEFIISDERILTAYNGTAESVSIPDEVVTISADAFGASSVADKIKTIKLGKSVDNIDTQAFVSLSALESIEVPEENTYFKFVDGVLLKSDDTLFFCMPNIIKDDYDMFDVFFDVISDNIDGEGEANLVSGGMMAEIERKYANSDDILGRKYYLYCKAFSANSQQKLFDEPYFDTYINGVNNSKSNEAYETTEGIVFSNTNIYGFGDTWIFAKDSIINIEIIDPNPNDGKIQNEEWYNYSVVKFIKGDDGSLNYTRIPRKYSSYGGTPDFYPYWTGLDEFAYEEGYVKIEDGKIIYNPVKSLTAKERGFDVTYIGSLLDLKSEDEVNEYLSRQAQKYEVAK